MNQIRFIKKEETNSIKTEYYEGFNCILKIQKLKFDNNEKVFMLEHKDFQFSPKIIPVQSEEDFFVDFSSMMAGIEHFSEVKNALTDIEKFHEEFMRRKEEFGFTKEEE